jgi:hypothetical protein
MHDDRHCRDCGVIMAGFYCGICAENYGSNERVCTPTFCNQRQAQNDRMLLRNLLEQVNIDYWTVDEHGEYLFHYMELEDA